jgi:hypothetical protein
MHSEKCQELQKQSLMRLSNGISYFAISFAFALTSSMLPT